MGVVEVVSPRRAQQGFTLLELVVTLFVLALATAVVVPAIGRGTEGLRVRAEVAGFSAFLRRAREQAITVREERAVTVDPAARVIVDEAGRQIRARRLLADRMTVEADPPEALTVRFSPQGLSSGGAFRLAGGNGVAYRITVDPLTGRVTSRREPR
jgi:general secretion pathway protein H